MCINLPVKLVLWIKDAAKITYFTNDINLIKKGIIFWFSVGKVNSASVFCHSQQKDTSYSSNDFFVFAYSV